MLTGINIQDIFSNDRIVINADFADLDTRLSGLYTLIFNNSGDWESVYTTVLNNSAFWFANNDALLSVYTTVCSNSAEWQKVGVYTTVWLNSAAWQSTYITTSTLSSYWHEKDHNHNFNINPVIGADPFSSNVVGLSFLDASSIAISADLTINGYYGTMDWQYTTLPLNSVSYIYITSNEIPATDIKEYNYNGAGLYVTDFSLPDTFNRTLVSILTTDGTGITTPTADRLLSVSYPVFHSIGLTTSTTDKMHDTNATGSNLNTLTQDGNADTLHTHSILVCGTRVPTTSTDSIGSEGSIAFDSDYWYIKISNTAWKRLYLSGNW